MASPTIGVSVKASASGSAGVTTGAVTTQTTKSTLLVGVMWQTSGVSFTSLTDSKNNTWTLLGSEQVAGRISSRLYYANGAKGGSSHTFTLTLSAGTFCNVFMVEVLPTPNGVDCTLGVHAEGPSDATSPYDSASILTAVDLSTVLAFYADDANSGTTTHTVSGFTVHVEETNATSFYTGCWASQTESVVGTYSASMTQGGVLQLSIPFIVAFSSDAVPSTITPTARFGIAPFRKPLPRRNLRGTRSQETPLDGVAPNAPEHDTATRSWFGWAPSRRPMRRRMLRATAAAPNVAADVGAVPRRMLMGVGL